MIKILKASAGSGKTFRLAKIYIELLLGAEDRTAYRHILAVTFTNKATDEMKSRILRELDILSRDPRSSGYFADFEPLYGPEEKMAARAGEILIDILHDYGAFSVSTIDKFFQQTLKAFAREVGRFASYQIEIDKKSLVRESVDRILDALSESDSQLLGWLTDSALEQLEDKGRFNIEDGLYSMAEKLNSDEFLAVSQAFSLAPEKVFSRENLSRIREACRRYMQDYEKSVREGAYGILGILSEAGVSPEDFYSKFISAVGKFLTFGDKGTKIEPPTESFRRRALDPEGWFAKKNAHLLGCVRGSLEGPLAAFVALFDTPWRAYNTARLLVGQLYSLGIAGEVARSFDELMREKNVLSLDDSNQLLRRIIAGSDAPFIYEKTGVRYDNFLLDEFQDTSLVQWENFRPLLAESDSRGGSNLIVGDVKQSIYRWRGSDWALLDSGVKRDFPSADDSESLTDNWRSLGNIVGFNNGFFEFASRALDVAFGEGGRVEAIYGDVSQAAQKGEGEGSVLCTFCPRENELDEVVRSVRRAFEAGCKAGQIAVLVRKNYEGSIVAERLSGEGIRVISDDSLRVKSSVAVRQLVSLLSHADNPADRIGGYLAESLGIEIPAQWHTLTDLCEDLLRKMDSRGSLPGAEILYVQSFLDELQDWTGMNGNSLSGFLRYWKDTNPKISSPADPEAVRVLTIHKAKGLEFPYVIFPFAEKVELWKEDFHWSHPDLKGTALEGVAEGAYNIKYTSRATLQTLFADDFRREVLLEYIDNINTFYVAMTRPERALHVIAEAPDPTFTAAAGRLSPAPSYADFSQMLYHYLRCGEASCRCVPQPEESPYPREEFAVGQLPDFPLKRQKDEASPVPAEFASYPLNPEAPEDPEADVRERGRLKFSADAVDFFSGETTPRKLGKVLHDILSRVRVPSDLPGAVRHAVLSGDLSAEEGLRYEALLAEKIASVASRGWFPEDRSAVVNEVSIIGTDGSVWRPDRVVRGPEGLTVIDYKFGREHASRYRSQVGRYMSLYRKMGEPSVSGAIWYISTDSGKDFIDCV